MQTWQHKIVRWQQIVLIAATTFLMLIIMLFSLNQPTHALRIASGAFGCGGFDTAVSSAPAGKTIVPMIPPRPSNAAVITKNLTIQGGWTRTIDNCDTENQQVTGTQGLDDAGFIYNSSARSMLQHNGNDQSVITIDPQVTALLIDQMIFEHTTKQAQFGGGISGSLNQTGATVRLDNVVISNSGALQDGGGLYMSLTNGSRLEILNSRIFSNTTDNGSGGGFEIEVHGNSHLVINNTQVISNRVTGGTGGGGHIIISSGFVTITNSAFTGNSISALNNIVGSNLGSIGGFGLSIEKVGSAPATVTLINTQTDDTVEQTGTGTNLTLNIHNNLIYLPLIVGPGDPPALQSQITGITINNDYNYEVSFNTTNFTPNTSSNHVHFFFDTVPATQAGVPGAGPWKLYGGPSPFTGYSPTDKPVLATQLCVLVANSSHAVTQNTGNCYPLPK